MVFSIILLVFSLGLILLAAEGFTNSIEAIGRRFKLSQAVVGNILAAVGTALPETILPFIAILFSRKESGEEIGVGAILGAPFMLSTLAFFLVGLTATILFLAKKRSFTVDVDINCMKRDFIFFIPMYLVAVVAALLKNELLIKLSAIILLGGYALYVYRTAKSESSCIDHFEGLHLINFPKNRGVDIHERFHGALIWFQLALSLAIMVFGARLFVRYLGTISTAIGFSPMLFALLLAPIATELPEKFNSITWTIKRKDSLAMGNVTGAMVFQATFPVSLGLLLTHWDLTGKALFSAVIALSSSVVVLLFIIIKKKLNPLPLLFGGVLYILYLLGIFSKIKF